MKSDLFEKEYFRTIIIAPELIDMINSISVSRGSDETIPCKSYTLTDQYGTELDTERCQAS